MVLEYSAVPADMVGQEIISTTSINRLIYHAKFLNLEHESPLLIPPFFTSALPFPPAPLHVGMESVLLGLLEFCIASGFELSYLCGRGRGRGWAGQ